MYDLKIVRNYAVALLENAANAKEQDDFMQQLKDIASLAQKGSKLYEVLCLPIITSDVKHKSIDVLAKKLKLNQKIVTFLKVLLRNNRFMLISEISEYFTKLYNDANAIKKAEVSSAKELSQKEIMMLEKFLCNETGMKVNIESKVDKNLLGGAVIKYDSTMIDCSIKGALEQIEKVAKKEY